MNHKNNISYKSNKKININLDFICLECYNIKNISIVGKLQKPKKFDYEIQYCYKCNKKTQHMCIGNIDTVEKELEFLRERTCREDRAYELVKRSRTRKY